MILKYLLLVGIISILLVVMGYAIFKEMLNNIGNINGDDNPGDLLTSLLSLEQVKNILGSELVGENKDLITDNIGSLTKLLDMIKNITSGLTQLNTTTDILFPDFLKDPQNNSLKIAKSDLELYNSKYGELSAEVNNMTSLTTKTLDNVSS